jgi:single-strand DNA-binding protein
MNNVEISGYLGADPVTRNTSGGKTVANARLASTDKWTDNEGNKREETTWVDFEAWGGWADSLGAAGKGDHVVIVGKLKLDEWEDKETKQKRSKLKVKATEVYLTRRADKQGGGDHEEGSGSSSNGRQSPPQRQPAPQRGQPAPQQEMFTSDL